MRPREHNRLGSQVRHFDHDLWQKDFERIVPRGNIAILSQKDEIRLALGHIDQRRLAEACPHDTLWCTGLSAFNLRASFPDTCLWKTCKKSFVRRPLRHYVTPYCRKRGFHGSHMRHCLARLIRSLTFASIRPPIQAMHRRPHPRFSPIQCPTTTPQRYVWLILNVLMPPLACTRARFDEWRRHHG